MLLSPPTLLRGGAPAIAPAARSALAAAGGSLAAFVSSGGAAPASAITSDSGASSLLLASSAKDTASIFDTVLNLGLTAIFLALLATILKFGFDFVTTAASVARPVDEAVADTYGEEAAGTKLAPGEALYDDTPNPNAMERMATLKKGTRATSSVRDPEKKIDFTKSESGFDFAPWMQIDQRAVARAEKERKARKAKDKKNM
ncbi:hypothetical protein EMIHUDRAFT_463546 [Emiliania huxleyi CCMP1516]|uniref:Uncharacterized protein n=2 Tax=Emiliania huxleyi TaxID=2903 RepID=A0A0D3JM84_EMIH1|nr:hypothetical protein EMIHUDRAFT_463546 [Emiliania huxleyi CCMP1516]EOD24619.1 hypothetical protein EMIHUDRAFT_463546 [Emiliania huxleyi CCMP1516]|eukprot:XP_005777048.1 hypothetical protein EMIHUDRAFT_463546 [Emiliania huxleyi CCMP1516]